MRSSLSHVASVLALAGIALTAPKAVGAQDPVELRPGGDPAAVRLHEQIQKEALQEGPSEASDDIPPTADADTELRKTAPLAGVALSPDALQGWTVLDENRQLLGTVAEVTMDPQSGEAKEVVIVNGPTGDRLTLPVEAIGLAPGEDVLIASDPQSAGDTD